MRELRGKAPHSSERPQPPEQSRQEFAHGRMNGHSIGDECIGLLRVHDFENGVDDLIAAQPDDRRADDLLGLGIHGDLDDAQVLGQEFDLSLRAFTLPMCSWRSRCCRQCPTLRRDGGRYPYRALVSMVYPVRVGHRKDAMETVLTETPGKLAKLTKCARPACACTVESGEQYCSDYCAAQANADQMAGDDACGCGHDECTHLIGAHVLPAGGIFGS